MVQGGAIGRWAGLEPKGHLPITWQANLALQHLTLASRLSLSNREPRTGGLALPTLPEGCAGKEFCSGTEGGVGVQAHVSAQSQPKRHPGQPSQGSRCEWLSAPLDQVSEPQSSWREGAGGKQASPRRLKGPSSGTAVRCLGMAGWGREGPEASCRQAASPSLW